MRADGEKSSPERDLSGEPRGGVDGRGVYSALTSATSCSSDFLASPKSICVRGR